LLPLFWTGHAYIYVQAIFQFEKEPVSKLGGQIVCVLTPQVSKMLVAIGLCVSRMPMLGSSSVYGTRYDLFYRSFPVTVPLADITKSFGKILSKLFRLFLNFKESIWATCRCYFLKIRPRVCTSVNGFLTRTSSNLQCLRRDKSAIGATPWHSPRATQRST
jgi:hypothetical protein